MALWRSAQSCQFKSFFRFLTANGRELTRIKHLKSKGYGDFKRHPQDEFKDFCNSLKIRVHCVHSRFQFSDYHFFMFKLTGLGVSPQRHGLGSLLRDAATTSVILNLTKYGSGDPRAMWALKSPSP
jgi:hypothetical protein